MSGAHSEQLCAHPGGPPETGQWHRASPAQSAAGRRPAPRLRRARVRMPSQEAGCVRAAWLRRSSRADHTERSANQRVAFGEARLAASAAASRSSAAAAGSSISSKSHRASAHCFLKF